MKCCNNENRDAKYALGVLTAINLLNYIDRYIPSSTKDLFKKDLGLTDAQTSIPLTAFIVVFMFACPVFGHLADKGISRKLLLMSAIIIWSLATGATFFSWNFGSFLVCRGFVGVGEAAYATIAPVLLSDFFPPERRNRALTIFYLGIPVGAALGFMLGGIIGENLGWRYAFLLCGTPGIVVSLLILGIKDPGRGKYDTPDSLIPISWKETLIQLVKNKMYVSVVIGYTLVAFGAGGMADWYTTYLVRIDDVSISSAGTITGSATVVGGLLGTMIGGYFADFLKGKTRLPYFALSGITLMISSVIITINILLASKTAIIILSVIAQILLWCYSGPMNAMLANCCPVNIRGRGFSLASLMLHLLGDAISPLIIGGISDSTGNLRYGIILVPIAICLGGITWCSSWRFLQEIKTPQESGEEITESNFRTFSENDENVELESHSKTFSEEDLVPLEE